jgi:protein TonB
MKLTALLILLAASSVPPSNMTQLIGCETLLYGGDNDTTVSTYDVPPRPTKQAPVSYPATARKEGIQGTVILMVTIETSGSVSDVSVKKSVREDIDKAAVASAHQWLFEPARIEGKPVKAVVAIPFRFKLDDSEKKMSSEKNGSDKGTPAIVKKVPPVYPEDAKKEMIEGTVHIELTVDADGSISDARILKKAHPSLDAAALEAVRQWKFEATEDREETTVLVVPIKFLLSKEK